MESARIPLNEAITIPDLLKLALECLEVRRLELDASTQRKDTFDEGCAVETSQVDNKVLRPGNFEGVGHIGSADE